MLFKEEDSFEKKLLIIKDHYLMLYNNNKSNKAFKVTDLKDCVIQYDSISIKIQDYGSEY